MEITAKIKGITYQAMLCRQLQEFSMADLAAALEEPAFICRMADPHRLAVSRWVTPKRTRSYPYARVYDTLGFDGKKATVIPLVKDEGKGGDHDFLQWDTVALMGLLGVYVVPAYYATATAHPRYHDKITNQGFDFDYVRLQLESLTHYHSSALHWNLEQFERIPEVGNLAVAAYQRIGETLAVEMHSPSSMQSWIRRAMASQDEFLEESRARSRAAQQREVKTIQPKEMYAGTKGSITIENHVGGLYHLTADNCAVSGDDLLLTESKHSSQKALPSTDDIKDGLLKMALFCNLTGATVAGLQYRCKPILRLSCDARFDKVSDRQLNELTALRREAAYNRFELDVSELKSVANASH